MRKVGSLERNREDQGERKSTGCKDDTHIRAEEEGDYLIRRGEIWKQTYISS